MVVGAEVVGMAAVGLPAEGLGVSGPDSDGVGLAAVDGLADAAPDGSSPFAGGATRGIPGVGVRPVPADGAVGDSPAAGPVRPPPPSRDPPEGASENPRPAISAAADTAPTAPAATATRRARHAPRRRREWRPAPDRPCAGTGVDTGIGGSSRVSPMPRVSTMPRVSPWAFRVSWVFRASAGSYTSRHPCAAAGSAYASYAGGGSVCGRYTFGGPWGSPPVAPSAYSVGLNMAANSRHRWCWWDSTAAISAQTDASHVAENTAHDAIPGRKLPDMQVIQSTKLANVCYEIRGPVLEEAMRLEAAGHRILKLNTGNPAAFGFECPPEILEDVLRNVSSAHGYGDAKGLLAARRAVVMHNQTLGIETDVEHVFIGNGVSELIVMAMQGLLDDGDEVLVPAPDYPLWTAAVSLSGGTAVHYRCDEQADWMPDLADVERKVTDRTKAIVIINPNNPTGAVYDEAMIKGLTDIARRHNLLVCSDEIYDKILYDGATHTPTAAVAPDLLTLTFNGMSKAYRVAGYRVGWMSISGPRAHADSYIEGLTILANMRLCANMPGQHGVVAALSGRQTINDLVLPGGRLREQRDVAYELLTQIPGVTCVKPKGALYLFPRLDPKVFKIKDDRRMVLDLLRREKIMVVQGTGFNWPEPDHFRVVTLPTVGDLRDAVGRIGHFLDGYSQA